MIIAIASGKGGTGKTTLAVNLAAALSRSEDIDVPVRLLDCDVEEPNDHLFVRPTFSRVEPVEVLKPEWNEELCTGCGECARACQSNAIAVVKGKVLIFPELCHACGVCSFICPEGAITERSVAIGRVELDEERADFAFGHSVLNIGEALAPKIVQEVKKHAEPDGITIIDASPGTACPVVEAVNGADVALMVTEPTPFGLNDLKLALGLSLTLGVPTAIIVNRSDGTDTLIQDYADMTGVPVIGRIPFKREYAETYSRGDLLLDRHPELRPILLDIYERVCEVAAGPPQPVPEEEAMAPVGPPGQPSSGLSGSYREVTVISGKGGTGKTTVTASLAALLDGKLLADCDVDAADLHLLLNPEIKEVEDFVGGQKATIAPDACTACGRCAEMCHFDAIEPGEFDEEGEPVSYRINEFACEGCGLCGYVCPVDAVDISEAVTGQSFVSETECGSLAHARLGIAE
ncbi:MAG: 4Fe-4S binding protein, partial [Candidatus Brocadiae bacterium]|nr:4Fe-4S binding protein [Candidatus Brocadiia bacterium]